jgi:hypothetical protein
MTNNYKFDLISMEHLQSIHMGQISQDEADFLKARMKPKFKKSVIISAVCLAVFAVFGLVVALATWLESLDTIRLQELPAWLQTTAGNLSRIDDYIFVGILILLTAATSLILGIIHLYSVLTAGLYLSALKHSEPGSVNRAHPLYRFSKLESDFGLLFKIHAKEFTAAEMRGLLNMAKTSRNWFIGAFVFFLVVTIGLFVGADYLGVTFTYFILRFTFCVCLVALFLRIRKISFYIRTINENYDPNRVGLIDSPNQEPYKVSTLQKEQLIKKGDIIFVVGFVIFMLAWLVIDINRPRPDFKTDFVIPKITAPGAESTDIWVTGQNQDEIAIEEFIIGQWQTYGIWGDKIIFEFKSDEVIIKYHDNSSATFYYDSISDNIIQLLERVEGNRIRHYQIKYEPHTATLYLEGAARVWYRFWKVGENPPLPDGVSLDDLIGEWIFEDENGYDSIVVKLNENGTFSKLERDLYLSEYFTEYLAGIYVFADNRIVFDVAGTGYDSEEWQRTSFYMHYEFSGGKLIIDEWLILEPLEYSIMIYEPVEVEEEPTAPAERLRPALDEFPIMLDGGYYIVDLGHDGEPRLFLLDESGKMVVDMWFDSIREWLTNNSWRGFYIVSRDNFNYVFRVEDGILVFSYASTSMIFCDFEKEVFISNIPVKDNNLSAVASGEHFEMCIRAVEFIIGLGNDYENTIAQICIERCFDCSYSDSFCEECYAREMFDIGKTISSVLQSYILSYNENSSFLEVMVTFAFAEDYQRLTWVAVGFAKEDSEWLIDSVRISI